MKTIIGPYFKLPAQFLDYNPNFPIVANNLIGIINSKGIPILIEHVGSTSVPNCRGKGIIDLAVLYYEYNLNKAKKAIDSLGFQRQEGSHAFPESRPMRTGSIKYKNKYYRIHVHILKFGSKEHFELITFREELKRNFNLKKQYELEKAKIIRNGITNSLKYSIAKGNFIKKILKSKAA
jgi:GrpB-like predicted nucleotidyltransferase (UPF0157 family)